MDTNRMNNEFQTTISPVSLKEITLMKISISLFNLKNIPLDDLFDWNEFRNNVSKLTQEWPFQAELEKTTREIGDKITKWVSDHAAKVLNNRYACFSLFGAIPFIVWNQNGSINYVETAKNMQFSRLDDTTKFRLAVIYGSEGLEHEINYLLDREDILSNLLTNWKWNNEEDILRKILSNASSDFKNKLTKTSIFYKHCEGLLFHPQKKPNELYALLNLSFSDAEETAKFKKRLIFSQKSVRILHSQMLDGRWSLINACMNYYLAKKEDVNNLKKIIFELNNFNDPITFARKMFLQNNESYWHSLLSWRFNNTKNIREFKRTLPVGDIFDELLKFAIFNKYDEKHRLSYCQFKTETNVCFAPLNRFLRWFFDTEQQIKEYKCRKAQSSERIQTIKTLLKKKDKTYLRLVIQWLGMDYIKYDGKIISRI